jgi:hypothetical protein
MDSTAFNKIRQLAGALLDAAAHRGTRKPRMAAKLDTEPPDRQENVQTRKGDPFQRSEYPNWRAAASLWAQKQIQRITVCDPE